MPAYNAEMYIAEAIESVIFQSWENWELIIINDGSTDNTEGVVKNYIERRIRCFTQPNKGASAARNVGLDNMQGEYFCFLDADDVLPPNSLRNRFDVFKQDDNIEFVDGVVEKKDSSLQNTSNWFFPDFEGGNPLQELVRLSGKCFFGLSWMIRRKSNEQHRFKEDLSHAEDLFFYMELAREGGNYAYSMETIYIYRNSPASAMKNLLGLERSYWQVYHEIEKWPELQWRPLLTYRLRVKKIIFLSYLRLQNDIKESLRSLFRN